MKYEGGRMKDEGKSDEGRKTKDEVPFRHEARLEAEDW
jgi:hypothetical protein